jgi:hypothetical protein
LLAEVVVELPVWLTKVVWPAVKGNWVSMLKRYKLKSLLGLVLAERRLVARLANRRLWPSGEKAKLMLSPSAVTD